MFGRKFIKLTIGMALAAVCVSCGKQSNQQIFQVKGVIEEIKPDGKSAVIKHEEIPNYMAAMTMEFETKNTNELKGLKPGDSISFRMIITDDDGWIDQVKKLNVPPTDLPTRATIRRVRDVDPLNLGD